MKRAIVSTTSLWLALVVGACSSESPTNSSQGIGGASKNSGNAPAGGSSSSSDQSTVQSGGSKVTGTPSNPQGGSDRSEMPETKGGSTSGTSSPAAGGSAEGGSAGSKGGATSTSRSPSQGGTTPSSVSAPTGGTPAISQGGKNAAGAKPTGSGGAPASGASGAAPGGSSSSSTSAVVEPKLVTSAENAYWKEGTITEVTSGNADVTINDGSPLQSWDGFGGTFNEVGWNVLSLLTPEERDRAIKLLFDAQEGARFAFGRLPIGASDYAMDRYTLDDIESGTDYNMDKFSIERDRQKLIPYIKAALAIKPDIRFWASPWTPPAWMKDNNAIDAGNMKDDDKVLQAHALYLSKYVEEYGKEGIQIEAIHPQNEPGYGPAYPSCFWTAALFNKFISSYLGPTFEQRKITAQIYLGTMSNNDAGKDGTIVTTVTGDSATMKYVKGFGLQWNMIDSVTSLKSKNLPIVQTEHKCGNYHWNPAGFPAFNPNTAPNDYPYAVESWGYIRDWVQKGVNSYSAWNMVLDSDGKNLNATKPWPQNALLTVNVSSKKLTVTPVYFVFRHVSQYVDPGAKVLGTSGGDAIAFKNSDGTVVAILYNKDAAKKLTVSVAGKKLQFDMPSNGWATINWK